MQLTLQNQTTSFQQNFVQQSQFQPISQTGPTGEESISFHSSSSSAPSSQLGNLTNEMFASNPNKQQKFKDLQPKKQKRKIKLEVNKLIRKNDCQADNSKAIMKQINLNSQENYYKAGIKQPAKSTIAKNSTQGQKKYKSFQQLYFEQIRKKKQLQVSKRNSRTLRLPISCKNSDNNSVMFKSKKQCHSAKNSNKIYQNKQNFFTQNCFNKQKIVIPKKQTQKNHKKIIKIKKNQNTSIKTSVDGQKNEIFETNIYQRKDTFLEREQIYKVVNQNGNHQKHAHVWGAKECFFDQEQTLFIQRRLQIQYAHPLLWKHLGGSIYGGIVKQNLIDFLSIVFEQDLSTKYRTFAQAQIPNNFIDESNLKLRKVSQNQKQYIKKLYFSRKLDTLAKSFNTTSTTEQFQPQWKNTQNQKHQRLSYNPQITNEEFKEQATTKSPLLDSEKQNQNNFIEIKKQSQSDKQPLDVDISPKFQKHINEPFKSTYLHRTSSVQNLSQFSLDLKSAQIRKPLLSVDVNLGQGQIQKLIVYEGQSPYEVSLQLKKKYNIDQQLRMKFQQMLQNHLRTMLFKIDEVSQIYEQSQQIQD